MVREKGTKAEGERWKVWKAWKHGKSDFTNFLKNLLKGKFKQMEEIERDTAWK